MSARAKATLIILLTIASAPGCYSTWDINPASLHQLDGFHKGQERSIIARNGERVKVTSSTAFDIRLRDGTHVSDYHALFIFVEGGILRLSEDTTGTGQRFDLEIAAMEHVRAENFDGKKTVAKAGKPIGIAVGIAALGGLLLMGLYGWGLSAGGI